MLIFAIALVASFIIATSNLRWWRKIAIIVLMCSAGALSYRGLNKFYGYPTVLQKSFDKVVVLGHLTDKRNGVIYLWLKEKDKDPRSYTVPFNHKLAKFLSKKRRQNRGQPFEMKLDIKTNQMNPFGNSINKIEPGEFPTYPPKEELDDM
jgi:hypothetical protein